MSKQCLEISQMQHLKELGVDTSKSMMCHVKFDEENEFSNLLPNNQELFERLLVVKYIPAFTLQDILDLLPTEIEKENQNYQLEVFRNPQRYFVSYYWLDNLLISLNEVEFIDAAYEMLCWCAENGYVETNKK